MSDRFAYTLNLDRHQLLADEVNDLYDDLDTYIDTTGITKDAVLPDQIMNRHLSEPLYYYLSDVKYGLDIGIISGPGLATRTNCEIFFRPDIAQDYNLEVECWYFPYGDFNQNTHITLFTRSHPGNVWTEFTNPPLRRNFGFLDGDALGYGIYSSTGWQQHYFPIGGPSWKPGSAAMGGPVMLSATFGTDGLASAANKNAYALGLHIPSTGSTHVFDVAMMFLVARGEGA